MAQKNTLVLCDGLIDELLLVSSLVNYLSHRDYYVFASAYFDEAAGKYFPVAFMSWQKTDGTHALEVISDSRNSCATWIDASNLALEIANSRKLS